MQIEPPLPDIWAFGTVFGVQVNVAELRDHEEQDVQLPHLLDLIFEFEEV